MTSIEIQNTSNTTPIRTTIQPGDIRQSISAGGKISIQLEDNARLTVSSDEFAGYQTANQSARTLSCFPVDAVTGVALSDPCPLKPGSAVYSATGGTYSGGRYAEAIELETSR